MFFPGAKLIPKQLWERKNHHHLYNSSLSAFEQANTRIDVFYAVQGKRIGKQDKPRVDALVKVLQRCAKSLQHNAAQALDVSTRDKLGDRDFKRVLRYEREVQKYLENVLELQAKLQRQVDAEEYFRKQESNLSQAEAKSRPKVEDELKQNEYLNKPLPPLRTSVVSFTTGLKSRKTIVSAEGEDVEIWLMLEDEELNPIINSYFTSRTAFEQDGFMQSPRNKEDWI